MTIQRKITILAICSFSLWETAALSATAPDTVEGFFSGTTNQLNRDIGDVPGNRYWADMRFKYQKDEPSSLVRKFDFSARLNDQQLVMFSLQEAYLGRKGVLLSYDHLENTGDEIRFGRQILDWSQLDAHWGLGKLNNRRNFDFFEPGQEGLVGLSYKMQGTTGVFWELFGSTLYVPELNPSLDIDKKNNTIKSRNPWANPPARSTEIGGNPTPIAYIVGRPEISEVVNRSSVGASFGVNTKRWFNNLFFIRKPENQLSPKVRVNLDTNLGVVKANVKPQFYYHDVFGGMIKYRNKGTELYVNGMASFPNTFPDGDERATSQTDLKTAKKREAYLGTGLLRNKATYGYGINYIARVSPFDRESDSLASDPRWNQAVNPYFYKDLFNNLRLSGDLKYDMLTTDRLVMLRSTYTASKWLHITLGVNMIGTPDSGKSFWSPYTNNDAAFGQLRFIY